MRSRKVSRKIATWKRNTIVKALGVALDEYEVPDWLKKYTLEQIVGLAKEAHNRDLL